MMITSGVLTTQPVLEAVLEAVLEPMLACYRVLLLPVLIPNHATRKKKKIKKITRRLDAFALVGGDLAAALPAVPVSD